MLAKTDPRDEDEGGGGAAPRYYYRRRLGPREIIPVIGVGIVIGLAAYYVARTFAERTPLVPEPRKKRPVPRARGG